MSGNNLMTQCCNNLGDRSQHTVVHNNTNTQPLLLHQNTDTGVQCHWLQPYAHLWQGCSGWMACTPCQKFAVLLCTHPFPPPLLGRQGRSFWARSRTFSVTAESSSDASVHYHLKTAECTRDQNQGMQLEQRNQLPQVACSCHLPPVLKFERGLPSAKGCLLVWLECTRPGLLCHPLSKLSRTHKLVHHGRKYLCKANWRSP
mmetsp:Transcript_12056/g.22141  ORF Transcript_12056/g.22141 Transcript_12056/m.22141 type:complete len:202 (-) Transcript_12056:927-1532(-)